MLEILHFNKNYFEKIIAGDKIWCFSYNLETKRQCEQWIRPNSPKPKKLRFQKSQIKTMLIFFLRKGKHYQKVVHKEFEQQNTTVTSSFYKDILEQLLKRITPAFTLKNSKIAIFSFCITMPPTPHTHKAITN